MPLSRISAFSFSMNPTAGNERALAAGLARRRPEGVNACVTGLNATLPSSDGALKLDGELGDGARE
jgi:hypothetical protein